MDVDREEFIEKILVKFHDLLDREAKADVLVMFGRREKRTGKKLPPQVQVREFGV